MAFEKQQLEAAQDAIEWLKRQVIALETRIKALEDKERTRGVLLDVYVPVNTGKVDKDGL